MGRRHRSRRHMAPSNGLSRIFVFSWLLFQKFTLNPNPALVPLTHRTTGYDGWKAGKVGEALLCLSGQRRIPAHRDRDNALL